MDDPGADNIFKKFFKSVNTKREVSKDDFTSPDDNVFEFDDSDVSDYMTHRTDIIAVEKDEDISVLRDTAIKEGCSRIPVYDTDIDNIIGIAYIKDILKFVDRTVPGNLKVSDIMRTAFYIPETMKCSVLFRKMIESHTQMAIVVDEYGGTAGLITLEDLIESVLGNIQDEFDDEEEEIRKISDNVFTVDGTTDIEEIEELFGANIPKGEYDTLGGFIISLIDFIPEDGSTVETEFENLKMRAYEIDDRRIGKVTIEKI